MSSELIVCIQNGAFCYGVIKHQCQREVVVILPDQYENRCPSPQTIVDLFEGEWTSLFPVAGSTQVRAGSMDLFNDPRISWAGQQLGGFANRSVLELGPLEAGHTYMLHRAGASEIVAIEANRRAFLKCLCVKELYALNKAHFMLGDFMPYLESASRSFDLTIASGVLYHMLEPMKMLQHVARVSNRLFLWTHYYDHNIISARPELVRKFGQPRKMNLDGFTYECVDYSYQEALNWIGFTGGTQASSCWLTRASIIDFLRMSGYQRIEFNFEQQDHPHGPAFALCAVR